MGEALQTPHSRGPFANECRAEEQRQYSAFPFSLWHFSGLGPRGLLGRRAPQSPRSHLLPNTE
jgi:hypothetical protein